MVTRAESAAATRRALLDAAAQLLDLGGPGAVTVREVGSRAGVTRGAPYRHFSDKESLLSAVATESWERIGDQVHALRTDPALPVGQQLRGALRALVGLGRSQPHLLKMMCAATASDPETPSHAAGRYRDEFLAIVAALLGDRRAGHYGALLLASVYGITDMELSGHLAATTWGTSADELVDTLVQLVMDASETASPKQEVVS